MHLVRIAQPLASFAALHHSYRRLQFSSTRTASDAV